MRLPSAAANFAAGEASAALLHFLRLAGELRSLPLVHRSHAAAVVRGLHRRPLLSSAVISAYSLLRLPALSLLVFHHHHSPLPDLLFYNSLLAALCRNALFPETLSAFQHFRRRFRHVSPDQFTLSITSKAAAELAEPTVGRALHSLVSRLGFGPDTVLSNSLMLMYFRCGSKDDACRLFDEMPFRSVASWNALVTEMATSKGGLEEEEMAKIVRRMQSERMKLDGFTSSAVLPLCGLRFGKQIHCFVIRNGLDLQSDLHVGSCLIDMYSRARRVDLGRLVFDAMASRNVVTCSSIIAGCVENGEFAEALSLFAGMQLKGGIVPNRITLVSVLPAIGSLSRLDEAKQVHGFSLRKEFNEEASLNNALICAYSKCGRLDYADRIFDDQSWQKDVISWSTMILCCGIHGRGEESIALFNEMRGHGFKLDHITGLAILSACARAGLAVQGLEIYHSLEKYHGVVPTSEMCSCMVDMLGRAGNLSGALNLIIELKEKPSPSVWGAFYGASIIHNDLEMQDLACRFLLELEPGKASTYVSLSNLHASSGRWDIVAQVRARIKDQGLRKIPAYSLVDVCSTVKSV